MRTDDALLLDMLLAARKIVRFLHGISETDFQESELIQSAVIREFQVLGEAARLLSEDTKAAHKAISWPMVAGMRNRLIHEYFDVRLEVVWDTAHGDIPILIEHLEAIVPPSEEDIS